MRIGDTESGRRAIGIVDCPDGWAAARLLLASAIEDSRTPGARALAAELRRLHPSDDDFARAIHAFVREHVRFQRERGEVFQNGGHTLVAGYGDCDDHARLAIALALAGGLRADLATLHRGDDAPPALRGPSHALAQLCPSNACDFAETTIAARYGEHPVAAARRLGVVGARRDITHEVRVITERELMGRDIDEATWPEKDDDASIAGMPLAHDDENARGIDISSAQGPNVDLRKVRDAGRSFVIVKLTDGLGVDRDAATNMKKARDAGLARSAYHFSSYRNAPEVEAKHFAATIRAMGGVDFPPTLDFESVDPATMRSRLSPEATAQWAVTFLRTMRGEGFDLVWLYSYPSYLKQLGGALIASGLPTECDLWIADYSKGAHPPLGAVPVIFDPKSSWYLPGTWETWACWQTHGDDDKGATPGSAGAPRLPGVPAAVDHDIFNGPPSLLGFDGPVSPLVRPGGTSPAPSLGKGGGGLAVAVGVGVALAAAVTYAVTRT